MRLSKKMGRALLAAAAMLYLGAGTPVMASELHIGEQGEKVASLQGQLTYLGYDLKTDGVFGEDTEQAVRDFQAYSGLDETGVVDDTTFAAIMRSDESVSRGGPLAARRIISDAMTFLGVPYVFGGSNPDYGFDCSAFVQYVFGMNGISLPRTADYQFEEGIDIAMEDLRPGDLVFFETYAPGASHVGIYIGDGDMIDATSGGVQVESIYSPYRQSVYYGAKRILA